MLLSKLGKFFIRCLLPMNAQIVDSSWECLGSCIRLIRKRPMLIFFYDRVVNLIFILYMLKRCGFGPKCCSWIKLYISTVCFFVLMNGTPQQASLKADKDLDNVTLYSCYFLFLYGSFSKMFQVSWRMGSQQRRQILVHFTYLTYYLLMIP